MKVCIAEKPSVAREIAQVLGATSRKDGYFEGNGYAVTWTFGHFCTLYQPDDYKPEWKRWDLNSLPMLPDKFLTKLMKDAGVRKQFAVIKKLFKTATLVINCGDAGQEGELIQRWVIKEAKYKGQVERLWISSLTKEAVKEGFSDLKPAKEFDALYHAGSARAIGDWLLGMNATRLYTLKYGAGKLVLSIGRVQTPTLAMLVTRHKEIINFVSTPFWELETTYRDVTFRYEKGRFENNVEGQGLLEKVTDKPFTIISFTKKKGKEYAPRLFDLTGLQVHCNKRFGFSADTTLKLVQKLYELKAVSYPRVDTTYLPLDVYPKIKSILSQLKDYQIYIVDLLNSPIRKSKRVFDDKKVTDHHAIIPTGVQARMDAAQQKVYDAICRRFIANFSPDCDVNNTVVIGESEGINFKTKGKEIVNPGWKILYPKTKKKSEQGEKSKNQEIVLPSFTKGESGPHTPSLVEKQTQPPKYYTEATLLRAMETAGKTVDDGELRDLMKENGIGRPSTRANIIETLFRRQYAYRKKKLVMATDLGIQLIDTIDNPLLKSAELTGQWEKKLKLIATNNYNPAAFIQEMRDMTDGLITEVRMSTTKSKIDVSHIPNKTYGKKGRSSKYKKPKPASKSLSKQSKPKPSSKKKSVAENSCPKCKAGVLIKGKTAYGCSRWKSGCDFTLPFSFMGKKISDNQYLRLLSKGSTVNLKGFKQGSTKINGLIRFDEKHQLVLEQAKKSPTVQEKETLVCPRCKKGHVIKGKTAYGCSAWQSGCDFRFSFTKIKELAKGKSITKEVVKQILYSK